MGDFHETGIEIWAGFGPVGITEKKGFWPIRSNFLDQRDAGEPNILVTLVYQG